MKTGMGTRLKRKGVLWSLFMFVICLLIPYIQRIDITLNETSFVFSRTSALLRTHTPFLGIPKDSIEKVEVQSGFISGKTRPCGLLIHLKETIKQESPFLFKDNDFNRNYEEVCSFINSHLDENSTLVNVYFFHPDKFVFYALA